MVDYTKDQARAWAKSLPSAKAVVVYCVRGHEVSQGAAAALNEAGIAARYLEGGFEGWKASQGPLDSKPRNGSTRWVTRERPKIDRIACPWLVARFVDADAEFHYVPAKEVLSAAKERDALPYDIPDVHFSHDGELCSFDAFLKHYRRTLPSSCAERIPRAWTSRRRRRGWRRSRSACRATSRTTTRC